MEEHRHIPRTEAKGDTQHLNMDSPSQGHEGTANFDNPQSHASSATILDLYRRGPFGKKHFYIPPSSSLATYYIKNPIPNKHSDTWKPVLHRGDNPKYVSTSLPIARARRTAAWSSFRIELGDGVHEVLENKRRVNERKTWRRKQKFRKFFCLGEKQPEKEFENEQPVKGFVMAVTMRRKRFLGRSMSFEWAGRELRWTGTRRFLPSWSKGTKGVSHAYKLVDSTGNLLATFNKNRWVSYTPSEKPGTTHNKNKSLVGTLTIFPSSMRASTLDIRRHNSAGIQAKGHRIDDLDHKLSGNKGKGDENVNLDGEHLGDLTEEVIAFTCWMMVEGEHRLRYKIFDVLAEVAEAVGG